MDGGGARATVELLLHFHGFNNLDLRSRGIYCVEAVAFPVSNPSSPGVPFRTFHDASARRSAARGVLVNPVEGDVEQRGSSGISTTGLPSYKSSLLPIRFTNERVHLNEGCLFRVHLDADWLETDVIAIEFRLLTSPLPENDSAPTEETPADSATSPEQHPEKLKEVGKVTLHTKCASSKGGLHRYHPLIFKQPHLCVLDITLHMALTSINHPGGPAGLAAAIAASAFPSEELGAPAPRRADSPARRRPSLSSMSTPPRSEGRRRSSSGSGRLSDFGRTAPGGPSPLRPRFITPGRSRKSAFSVKGRSSSFGAGSALRFGSSPDRSRAGNAGSVRPHRMPLSAAALEAAANAVGLATALGHAPPAVDAGRARTVRAVYRAAELLYSRHALGLRWSKGALAVAKDAAAANAAEMATASVAAAAAVAAKRRVKGKSRKSGGGGGGGGGSGGGKRSGGQGTKDAENGWKWGEDAVAAAAAAAARAAIPSTALVESGDAAGGTDGSGGSGGRRSPRHISPNGELEDVETGACAGAEKGTATTMTSAAREAPQKASEQQGAGEAGGRREGRSKRNTMAVPLPKSKIEIRTVASPRPRPNAAQRKVPPSPAPAPLGNSRSKTVNQQQQKAGGAEAEGCQPSAQGAELTANGGNKGRETGKEDGPEASGAATWTWGGSGAGGPDGKDTSKTPLPSDLRQLSRVIHAKLHEESLACSKAWSAFAKSTFECGRRDLIALREEWVRDTTRAWSGQCLEIMSRDRADLVRLNQTLLEPDGFVPLRARAGIRLKRRASPTGRRSRGGGAGGNGNPRRRQNGDENSAHGASGADRRRNLPNGIARLRALSSSGVWSDAKVFGRSNSTASASGGCGGDGEDDHDDDDHPPLLEALVQKKRIEQQQQQPGAGKDGSARSASASMSSLAATTTPKDQPTTSSSWGAGSPWRNASSFTPQRAEMGWLSRIASGGGGGGSAVSSPTGSSSSFSFSGTSTAEPSPPHAGMVMHFPPPPQSLLPTFDRELHGFDSLAPEDERWGELPFLVVESWGGLGDDAPPEPAPLSPMLCGDEYRLFQEIASNSIHNKKPPLLPNGKPGGGSNGAVNGTVNGGSSFKPKVANGYTSSDDPSPSPASADKKAHPRSRSGAPPASAAAAAAARSAAVRAIPPIFPPENPPAPPGGDTDPDTPPPACYVPSTPCGRRSAKPRPILVRSNTVPAPPSPNSPLVPSVWSSGSEKPDAAAGGGRPPGGTTAEKKSIWDQPEKPTRQQRGPKYYTARRPKPPSRAPSLPSNGSGSSGGGGSGSGGGISDVAGYSSSEDVWSGGDGTSRASGEVRRNGDLGRGRGGLGGGVTGEGGGGVTGEGGGGGGGGGGGAADRRKRTRRDEIQKRMWGKRPSWTGALIEPAASAATAGAAAASVPGVSAREGAGAAAAPRTESGLNHLIVLVHGLGGRPADMALMRSYLQTLMPGAEVMVATSLQDARKDNLGVEAMGKRLAEEVHNHVTRFCPYLGSAFVPVPTIAAPTANGGGSLPLSPVTPMRPPRRGGSVNPSPMATRAAPGSAAAARAVSEEIGVGGGGGTPARPPKGRVGSGPVGGGGGGGGGGVPHSKGTMSFVCFSLGGLVARSALLEPAMVPYLTSMQCFVTLACPHLGQTSTPLSFFKTGAWAVRKLTGLQVLHELDLDDADDPRETALYRLSLSPGLERFRTIVFAANPRDGFVPLHSACVRAPPDADPVGTSGSGSAGSSGGGSSGSSAPRRASAAAEMAEMLMSKVDKRANRVVRMTLDAPRGRQPQGALDTVIGRAGHMCFIDSAQVAWLLSLALLPFLEENVDRSSWPPSSFK